MRSKKMAAVGIALVCAAVIFTGSALAATWTPWGKITYTAAGESSTVIGFTGGNPENDDKPYVYVGINDASHNRILAIVLSAMSSNQDVRFYVHGAWATRVQISTVEH